ncbi:hypothetical protein PRZ48_002804 [Zasmidium cellare]|uniref:Uncharacterized protein n=1 Tax=Zasmidium cellare TaxID=395010 RepID=A0ABR0ET83_ZASCE|nr:hypothetical protein PRZ48_002804 [Zasmidium cellare]
MRFLRPTLALLALPSAILAVSLSDFTPRVSDDDLPKSCLAVYTQTINGCEGSDFGGTCSAGCMKALDSFASKHICCDDQRGGYFESCDQQQGQFLTGNLDLVQRLYILDFDLFLVLISGFERYGDGYQRGVDHVGLGRTIE